MRSATGHVWTVLTDSPKPDGRFTVVSTMHLGSGVQCRIVGEGGPGAIPAEPTLEDGYIRLMQERRGTQARAA